MLSLIFCFSVFALCSANLERPRNVRVISRRHDGFRVQWDYTEPRTGDSEFLIRYRKYRSIASRSSAPWTEEVTETNRYLVTPLAIGYSYDFEVKLRSKDYTNRVTAESEWSPRITVTISSSNGGSSDTYSTVPTPTELTARVRGPRSIGLRWKLRNALQGDYFLITLIPDGNEDLAKTVRTDATSVTIRDLIPGTAYRIRVKTRRQGQDSNLSHSLHVRLPTEEEHVTLTDLFIRPDINVPGKVNLTWQIPEHSKRYVTGFTVRYSTEETDPVDRWRSTYISGQRPTVVLEGLRPDTEYFVQIQAQLRSGVNTDSSMFRFRTPKPNPIKEVQIFYNTAGSSMRLDWAITREVIPSEVAGYHVLVTQNPQLPDDQWRTVLVNNRGTTVTLDDYVTQGSFFWVKIYVRKTDGTIWKSPTVYKFQTLRSSSGQVNVGHVVNYKSEGTGRVQLRWTYPSTYRTEDIRTVRLFYTTDKTLPVEQWTLKEVRGRNPSSVFLTGLEPDTHYYVRILPLKSDGTYLDPTANAIVYKINTNRRATTDVRAEVDRVGSNTETDSDRQTDSGGGQYPSQLCFRRCRVGRSGECGSEERCISTSTRDQYGWCISDTLVRAIRRSHE